MRDELTDRLALLESRVSQATRLVAVADVRRRGDRRTARTGRAAVVAIVVALTGGVAVAVAGGGGGSDLTTGPTAGPITALPARVHLPHEGEPGWWLRLDADAPAVFQPCSPGSGSPVSPEVTLTGRTDARTASGPIGTDASLSEQVLLYSSAGLAAGAMRELMDAAQACGWDGPTTLTHVDPPLGVEAVSGWTSMALRRPSIKSAQGPAGQPGPVFELALVRRVETVVVIVYTRSPVEFTDNSVPDASFAALTSMACATLHQCSPDHAALTPTPWLWPTPATGPSGGASPR